MNLTDEQRKKGLRILAALEKRQNRSKLGMFSALFGATKIPRPPLKLEDQRICEQLLKERKNGQ